MPVKKRHEKQHTLLIIVATTIVALASLYIFPLTFTYANKEEDTNNIKNEGQSRKEREKDEDKISITPTSAAKAVTPTLFPTSTPIASQVIIVPDTSEKVSKEVTDKANVDEEKDKKNIQPENIKPVVTEENDTRTSFFINSGASLVENPFITFSGTKSPGSAVYLNSNKVVIESPETPWKLAYLLSPGKNKLRFESRDSTNRDLGSSELEIIYRPQTGSSTPVVNIIKEKVSADVKLEIEKTIEKKIEEKSLTQELPKLSEKAQEAVQNVVSEHQFNYISENSSTALSRFVSYEDQKEVVTQTFGGPRVTSATHRNQNIWSSQNDVEISWEKVDRATSYKIGIANSPIEPTIEVSPATNNWKFSKLSDGIWYFSVKARVPGGMTLTNFYRLMIDTSSPKIEQVLSADAYTTYKNGSLVTIKVKFSDNILNAKETANLPTGLPVGFIDDESFKNIQARSSILPDYSRLIDADFSSLDTNYSKDRIMIEALSPQSDGSIEATISYRISTNNKKGDGVGLSILITAQDYVGNKSYATASVSLVNKSAPVQVANLEDLSTPVSVTAQNTQGITLRGKSAPNSTVVLQIYSGNPITVTVLSDNDGNWTYTLKEALPAGNHTVYAYVKKDGVAPENVAQVASFSLVTEAQAKELTELSKPIFSFKPVVVSIPTIPASLPSLPTAIKLALLLYAFSFASLIAALIVWYRENPPHNV